MVLPELTDDTILQVSGILEDLPEGVTFDGYQQKLRELLAALESTPLGKDGAEQYETIVGETVRLCFFRALTNIQPKVRSSGGLVIRDWIASNRAAGGFWEMVRNRYDATQVIWECKNYLELSADDFHQVAYYMDPAGTRFIVMAFRGNDVTSGYYRHMEKIAKSKGGMVLVITEKDLKVFIRQALKGKFKEDHINELYDRAERSLS